MAASDASKHDLTSELGKFLDRHLVFPLLEFLQAKKVYPEAEILEAKIALLQKTNMLDFAADIYKSLHNAKDVPPEMTKRREEVIANLTELQAKAEKVVTFLSDPTLVKQLRSDKAYNINFLKENHDIGEETSTALPLRQVPVRVRQRRRRGGVLYHYRSLCTNGEKGGSASGVSLPRISSSKTERAVEDTNRLKDAVENRQYPRRWRRCTRARGSFTGPCSSSSTTRTAGTASSTSSSRSGTCSPSRRRRRTSSATSPRLSSPTSAADPCSRTSSASSKTSSTPIPSRSFWCASSSTTTLRLRSRSSRSATRFSRMISSWWAAGRSSTNAVVHFRDVLPHPPVHRHQPAGEQAEHGPRQRGAMDREPHPLHQAQRQD